MFHPLVTNLDIPYISPKCKGCYDLSVQRHPIQTSRRDDSIGMYIQDLTLTFFTNQRFV